MHTRIQTCVSVMLALLLAPAMPAAPDGSGSYPPPASGDWVITNDTWVANETLYLGGNVTVEGSNLTLVNVTLIGNQSGASLVVTVPIGSSIETNNCTFKAGRASDLSFDLRGRAVFENCTFVKGNGTIGLDLTGSNQSMTYCIVEGTLAISSFSSPAFMKTIVRDAFVGTFLGSYSTLSGLAIQNCTWGVFGGTDSTIDKCTLVNCLSGLVLSTSTRVRDTAFTNCISGVLAGTGAVIATGAEVSGCLFENCSLGISCGPKTTISGSRFISCGRGIDVLEDADQFTIDRCWFEGCGNSVLAANDSAGLIQDSSFLDSTDIDLEFSQAWLTLRDCRFASRQNRHRIDGRGGMLDLYNSSLRESSLSVRAIMMHHVEILNSTLSGNDGVPGTEGSASVELGGFSGLTLRDCTILDPANRSLTALSVVAGTCWLIGTTFPQENVEVANGARLDVFWHLTAEVLSPDGTPAGGALVRATDSHGNVEIDTQTGTDGVLGHDMLKEFYRTGNGTTYFTPYWLNASRDGLACNLSVNVNQNLHLRLVLRDISPPWIAISSPADGSLLNRAAFTVSGQAGDEAGIGIVRVRTDSGDWSIADGTGNWSIELNLSDGQHLIEAQAVDEGLNTAADSVTVGIDTVPPVLVITAPENGTLVNNTSVEISGRAEAGSALVIDGEVVPVSLGAFRMEKQLREGPNRIVIIAGDPAGNAATVVLQVVRDTIPPALTVSSPRNGMSTNSRSITMSGTMEPDAKLYFEGSLVPANGSFFSFNATLSEGMNNLSVWAEDAAGNRNCATVRVVLDTVPPFIIVEAADGAVTSEEVYVLNGRVEAGSALSVNGLPAEVSADGRFRFELAVHVGNNTVQFVARDSAGNTASLERTLVREASDIENPDGAGGGGSSRQLEWAIAAIIFAIAIILFLFAMFPGGRRGIPPGDGELGGR